MAIIDTFKDNLSKHFPREIGMNPSIFQKSHTLKKKVFEAFIVHENFEIYIRYKMFFINEKIRNQ